MQEVKSNLNQIKDKIKLNVPILSNVGEDDPVSGAVTVDKVAKSNYSSPMEGKIKSNLSHEFPN